MKKILLLLFLGISVLAHAQNKPPVFADYVRTDSITTLTDNTDLPIYGRGTGTVVLEGLSYPNADGTTGQAIITDGTGTLTFGDVSSVTFGTDNQIPFMNAGGTDFEYSIGLLFNGSTFTLGADLDFSGANHNISNTGDIDFQTGATGGTIRTGTSNADKWQLQAYDVNGAAHQTVASAHAGNDPLFHLFSNSLRFTDATDNTKRASFDLSGITTGTTRAFTFPDTTGTIALTSDIANQVTATSTFGTDNRLLRSDGTGRESQSSAISVDDSGNMSGVGTFTTSGDAVVGGTSPLQRLHVKTSNGTNGAVIGNFSHNYYGIAVESEDAVLGLISKDEGGHGSGIDLMEVDGGVLADKWWIGRHSSGTIGTGDSRLEFTYGTNADYSANPRRFTIYKDNKAAFFDGSTSTYQVGIGTATLNNLELAFGASESQIGLDADNKRLQVGGATVPSVNNGAYINIMGNSYTGQEGDLAILAGNNATNGRIRFFTGAASDRGGIAYNGSWSTNGNSFTAGAIISTVVGTNTFTIRNNDDNDFLGAGTGVGTIDFQSDEDGTYGSFAQIVVEADVATDADYPGRILFKTTPDGSSTPVTGLTIKSNQYVGIGTSSPEFRLHVYESASNAIGLIESDAANSLARLELRNDVQAWDIRNIGSSNDEFHISDLTNVKNPFKIQPNAPSNSLFIQANGQVGIGTGTPGSTLDVNGSLTAGAGSFSGIVEVGGSGFGLGEELTVGGTGFQTTALFRNFNTSGQGIGRYAFYANNGIGGSILYGGVRGQINDNTSGSEDGQVTIEAFVAGTNTTHATFQNGNTTLSGSLTAGATTVTSATITGATASTLSYFNASKQVTSLANGTGFLFNDGSGNFSYDNTVATFNGFTNNGLLTYNSSTGDADVESALTYNSGAFLNNTTGASIVAQTSNEAVSMSSNLISHSGSAGTDNTFLIRSITLDDSGTNPIMKFEAAGASVAIATRPLFQWENYQTVIAEVSADGNWDYQGNSVTNADILGLTERSSDPGDPSEGQSSIWQSDGTGSGDDGDIMIKVTAGGVTKTITLVDFSAF